MAKYDPLSRYLSRRKTGPVELSFAEIERLIGALLPKAAARAEWWNGHLAEGAPAVHLAAWRPHGLRASLMPGRERVRFDTDGDAG